MMPDVPSDPPSAPPGDDEAPPLAEWATLGARAAMRALRDLPRPILEQLHGYEERHLRRTSVLAAIRRTLARLDAAR